MTPDEFLLFCQREQFESTLTKEQVSDLIEMFNSLEFPGENNISFITFCTIIFNRYYNSVFDNKKQQIYQPMTYPLSQYFIKSTNYKLFPDSTNEQCIAYYNKIIKFGYRYIEIDCWEGPNGTPKLLPSNDNIIPCEIILKVIALNVFEYNSYPFILGLNIQCGNEQQNCLAELIQNYLGNYLYVLSPNCIEIYNLPSPEQLQNKILIHSFGSFLQAKKLMNLESIEIDLEDHQFNQLGSKVVNKNLLQLLSLFGQKSAFDKDNQQTSIYNLNYLSVKKLKKHLEYKEAKLISFNKKYLTKISQLNEENKLNAFDGFLSGAQIACIGDDFDELDLFFYDSKFQENGDTHSGYILKPQFMRNDYQGNVSPSLDFQAFKLELTINIISAYQIISNHQNTNFSAYKLEISMIGLCNNNTNQKFVSQASISDGFRIEFNNFYAKFYVQCPELAMIIFILKEEEKIIGFYGIPVECIRCGYRVIPVKNALSLEIMENSSIFSFIQVQEIK